MAEQTVTSSWAPWEAVYQWAPFKIDALGLVTLLGAEEINAAVGRLVRSAYLEYLPMLGAFVIAGDRFTEKAAGFNLYNITQGIHTTDLAAWLTRWMLSQNFEVTRSYVVWTVTPPKSRRNEIITSFIISFVFNGFLIAMTVLSRDWYGFANALAMVVSVVVRTYVLGQQRAAVDAMIDEAISHSTKTIEEGSYEARRLEWKDWKDQRKQERKSATRNRKTNVNTVAATGKNPSIQSNFSADHSDEAKEPAAKGEGSPPMRPNPRHFSNVWKGDEVKVLIIQTDSKAVTFSMPKELLKPPSVFIEGPNLLHPQRYVLVRSIGWAVFAVHIVAIGMADLASQMYTVALLVLPTILLVLKLGCDDSRWKPTIHEWMKSSFGRPTPSRTNEADENAMSDGFVKKRECWIGSRLRAEIYEWPASYEFKEVGEGKDKKWISRVPESEKDRSKKRQDLYAWLALAPDEEESMDKWDLFPHIREDDKSWWYTYKKKKNCLTRNPHMGPQLIRAADGSKAADGDIDDLHRGYNKPGRTSTFNFVDDPATGHKHTVPRRPSVMDSSAFPAISDHEAANANSENSCNAESQPEVPPEDGLTGSGDGDASPRITPATKQSTSNAKKEN
ncbi:uncharacterized protein Z518_06796 [Rhinocladiella mackenziei CBS 650.93]|uniref:Uncharacterized protein n=1 Tax=Rhinocladiella mackenziei CBS 650.93 TaxID=1442369 RepID=A0A0D2IBQ0_9EURO|nr:uncharacterized protein Z518_06796 [Rhinocladiella mackenziei CBS 650.93]KIX03244.1 hypothetical protein Z518_06796 [Rhinocladiella mackenziei CBS 650.93]